MSTIATTANLSLFPSNLHTTETEITTEKPVVSLQSELNNDGSDKVATPIPPEKRRDRRYLIRQPRALQYFHKGKLYKVEEKERVAGRFELFFDLLYVALIANFADDLVKNPSGVAFLKFILVYTPAWHAWADAKENANNYYNDDITQRIGTLWTMSLLILYGNNANLVAESLSALRVTVGSYMLLRFSQVSYFAYYSLASPFHRLQNRVYFVLSVVGLMVWVPLLCEGVSMRAKVGVAVTGIVYEQVAYTASFGPWLARFLNLRFHSAVDIAHESDRYSAFTIIVLGEFTYGILVGSPAAGGLNTGIARAICTLIMAFCFNSMYDYCDGSVRRIHPLRRSVGSSLVWLIIHLPMSAALLVGGHTSANAVGEEEMGAGRRWLFGGGLAAGMAGMWIIGMLHRDEDEKGMLLLQKNLRLAPRFLGVLIFALLPLVPADKLSSTSLLGIGASVTAFVVIWETVAALDSCAGVWESWQEPHVHQYRLNGEEEG